MGYHVSIVRTNPSNRDDASSIDVSEIISVVQNRFGFEVEYDDSGRIKQISRNIDDEGVLLFYDDGELWAKSPEEYVLKIMIEIACALGGGARVRGDEGETYQNSTSTYTHPDDIELIEESKRNYPHWKDVLSMTPPILIGIAFLYVFGKMVINYLSK